MSALAVPAKRSTEVGGLDLPGVTFTATGCTIEPGISFENWARLLAFIEHLAGAIQWWIGDALVHGEREFGEAFAQAVGGRSPEAMKTYLWVAERVPPERRREALSWSAHREVASLEPDRQVELLDHAEAEGLGSRDVRALMRADRAEAEPEEVVSVTLSVTRGTLARLHALADGRPLGEVVAELVSAGA